MTPSQIKAVNTILSAFPDTEMTFNEDEIKGTIDILIFEDIYKVLHFLTEDDFYKELAPDYSATVNKLTIHLT